ncbi:MAG: hypothetical protein KC649_05855 [Candidatus Omnitrophica bacterium]|nr:hypothetical protein [Candidatus Omnitrophota bacterium]
MKLRFVRESRLPSEGSKTPRSRLLYSAFSKNEMKVIRSKSFCTLYILSRLTAKTAVSECIVFISGKEIPLNRIEIVHSAPGAPVIQLPLDNKQIQNRLHISISHTRMSVASVAWHE